LKSDATESGIAVMPGQPRRHHYVPQFYLIGFTKSGTADGTLHVLDQQRLKQWSSTPANVALENGFYTVELGPSVDAAVVERTLSRLETDFAPVIRDIAEKRSLPPDEAFGTLMSFVAVMAARVPKVKNTISEFLEDVARKHEIMRREIARRQGGAQQSEKEAERPTERNEAASLCNQTTHVQLMMDMVPTLIPLLSQRNWSLWELEDGAPDLICSDRPVSLSWVIPMSGLYPPGFGSRGTVVTVPLTRRIALVGTFEPQPAHLAIGAVKVACLNSATGMYANQLYSSEPDFVWRMKNSQIGRAADLVAALRSCT
jgi:hypothetical protein